MSGFGDFGFDDFSFGSAAEEDPYGISPGRKSRESWLNEPYGAKRRKSGAAAPRGSVGGYPYQSAGPDPSTTQRAVLEAKQKQEEAARIFGGEAPREEPSPGAFMSDNQTWLGRGADDAMGKYPDSRYLVPDPTNPGHQDAAREKMDISLQDYNDYFADKEAIKKLEDEAYALPKRTGFGGAFDRQRDALYQRAEVLRRRNAERRAANPAAFGGSGGGPDDWVNTGKFQFNKRTREWSGPPDDLVARMNAHEAKAAKASAAPHLETLISPRTGKTVRADQSAIPKNAQGQLVERYFQRDSKLQGPQQPGVDSLGETREEPYGVPDTAAETAAASRERIAKEKASKTTNDTLTSANRIAISGQKRQVDSEIAKQKADAIASTPAGPKRDERLAALDVERQRQYDRIDADTAPPGAAPKRKAGTTNGVKWRRVG